MSNKSLNLIGEIAKFIFSMFLIFLLFIIYSYSFFWSIIYYILIGVYMAIETYSVYPDIIKEYSELHNLNYKPEEIKFLQRASALVCGIFWFIFPILNVLTSLGIMEDKSISSK